MWHKNNAHCYTRGLNLFSHSTISARVIVCQKHNDLGIDICRSHHAGTDARSSLRKGRGSKQQNVKGATAMDWDSFSIAVKDRRWFEYEYYRNNGLKSPLYKSHTDTGFRSWESRGWEDSAEDQKCHRLGIDKQMWATDHLLKW